MIAFTKESLTPDKLVKFKYIIHICGHVSAYRLSFELSLGSVILLVDSEWRLWFQHLLIPYVHYVPVKSDLSDIYEQIKWCKDNDDKCSEIVNNARLFYETYLNKESILTYLQNLLFALKD